MVIINYFNNIILLHIILNYINVILNYITSIIINNKLSYEIIIYIIKLNYIIIK